MTTRFVAQIDLITGGAGATTAFYVASSGFSTKPTDTPANTHIPGRLLDPGSLQRELFSGRRVFGAVRPSFGEIVLANDDGEYDDWLTYGIAGAKVTVRWGAETDTAYPGDYDTVYIAYCHSIVADFSTLRIRLRDRLELLDRPVVTESFAGTGGLEGTTALAGKLKQWVSSDPGYLPPVLVTESLWLYYVQSTRANPLEASFALYEGGVALTRGTDYPDAATCLSTAPSAGQCRFWFGTSGAGPVYVRLGTAPAYDLRVYPLGQTSSGAAWTVANLASVAGITGGTGTVAIGAQLVDDPEITYAKVMEDGCAAAISYFGMTRLDALVSGAFAVPAATALYSFTRHNARDWQRLPLDGMDTPVWSVAVEAGETWPSNLQASATAALKDYLSRTPVWSSFAAQTASIKTNNPAAQADTLRLRGRHFQNAFGQSTFTNAYLTLFGGRRDFFQFTVAMSEETLALELHDTVELKIPRFGCETGRNFRIVTQRINCGAREITFGVWGIGTVLSTDLRVITIVCGNETTALTTGTAKATFRMPYGFTLSDVRASVTTAPTGGTLLAVDVNESGSTILSTKLTFDASEKTTTTAATPRVIADSLLADDAEITIDIDAIGSTIAGAGLKVYLIGTPT